MRMFIMTLCTVGKGRGKKKTSPYKNRYWLNNSWCNNITQSWTYFRAFFNEKKNSGYY